MSETAIGAVMPAETWTPKPSAPPAARAESEAQLRHLAQQFEATFLGEMLKHAGLGAMPERFNGGAGEAAFGGFLTQEYAGIVARTGKLGIAEQVFQTMKARSDMA